MTTRTELSWRVDPSSSRWVAGATAMLVSVWEGLGLAVVGVAVATGAITVLDDASVLMMVMAVLLVFFGLGLVGLLILANPGAARRLLAGYYLGVVDPGYIGDNLPRSVRVLGPLVVLPAMALLVVLLLRGGTSTRVAVLAILGLMLLLTGLALARCGDGRLAGSTLEWTPHSPVLLGASRLEIRPGSTIEVTTRWGLHRVTVTSGGRSVTVTIPIDRLDVIQALEQAVEDSR